MSKPTPTPWMIGMQGKSDTSVFAGKRGEQLIAICDTPFDIPKEEKLANAAHIVKCVIMHDELIAGLMDIKYAISNAACLHNVVGSSADNQNIIESIGEIVEALFAKAKADE